MSIVFYDAATKTLFGDQMVAEEGGLQGRQTKIDHTFMEECFQKNPFHGSVIFGIVGDIDKLAYLKMWLHEGAASDSPLAAEIFKNNTAVIIVNFGSDVNMPRIFISKSSILKELLPGEAPAIGVAEGVLIVAHKLGMYLKEVFDNVAKTTLQVSREYDAIQVKKIDSTSGRASYNIYNGVVA